MKRSLIWAPRVYGKRWISNVRHLPKRRLFLPEPVIVVIQGECHGIRLLWKGNPFPQTRGPRADLC